MGGWSLAMVLVVVSMLLPVNVRSQGQCGQKGRVCCNEGYRIGLDETWSWEKDMRVKTDCETCAVFLYWNNDMDVNNPSAYAAVYACIIGAGGECVTYMNTYGEIVKRMGYEPYKHADWFYPHMNPHVGPVKRFHMQCCNSIEKNSPKCPENDPNFFKQSIYRSYWETLNFNTAASMFPNGLYCTIGNITYVDGESGIEENRNLTTRTWCWYCITLDIFDKTPASGNFTRRRLEFTCSKYDECETFVQKLPKNDNMKIVDCKSCRGEYNGIWIEPKDRCNDWTIPKKPGPTTTSTPPPPPKLHDCSVGSHEYGKADNNLTIEQCVMCGYRLSRNVSQPHFGDGYFMGAYLAEYFCINDTAVVIVGDRGYKQCKRLPSETELRPGFQVDERYNNCTDESFYGIYMYNIRQLKDFPSGFSCYDSDSDWWLYDNSSNPKTVIHGCAACNIEKKEEDEVPKARLKCVKRGEDFDQNRCISYYCNQIWDSKLNRPAGMGLSVCLFGNQFAMTKERNRPVCSLAVHENGLAEYPRFDSYAECLAAQRNLTNGIEKLMCCWNPNNTKPCLDVTIKVDVGQVLCSGSKQGKKCDACRTEKVAEPCLIGNATWLCNLYRKSGEARFKCCFSDYCNGPPPTEDNGGKKGSTGGNEKPSYVNPTQDGDAPGQQAAPTFSPPSYYLHFCLFLLTLW